jgi:hypothetical protein
MPTDAEWLPRIQALDERLRPIANRPVSFDEIAFMVPARPLDEANVRPQAQKLLADLVEAYQTGDESARATLRSMFRRFSAFAWAASLAVPQSTPAGFRAHLLHFSMLDQGTDPRDATLSLDQVVRSARDAGVDVDPILHEVASLSSTEDRYSWGSTSQWLMRRTLHA